VSDGESGPARRGSAHADAADAERRPAPSVPRATLAPGYTISRVIKGGWQLAGGHGDVAPDAALADMGAYADAGITTFDCADIYTGVEALIGRFLRERAADAPAVQVHTKCVPDLDLLATCSADDLARTVHRSRERLGVEALDLVQFHWWDYGAGDFVRAAQHLAALREAGAIRHLGATNFDTPSLRAMLDAGVPIVAQQVQYSLLDRRPAGAMTALAAERGVQFLCYGVLAGGFFHERWLGAPEPTGELPNRSLVKYKLIIDECGGWDRFQRLLRVLADVGGAHGVGIGAVAIAWVLAQPAVAAVIAGARDRRHLADTARAATLALTAADHAAIDAVLAGQPVPPGDVYSLERDREGRHGRIMRYNLNRP
jgi:aryl-alcohol dehydrogenase-like predicted oxidoreductase